MICSTSSEEESVHNISTTCLVTLFDSAEGSNGEKFPLSEGTVIPAAVLLVLRCQCRVTLSVVVLLLDLCRQVVWNAATQ